MADLLITRAPESATPLVCASCRTERGTGVVTLALGDRETSTRWCQSCMDDVDFGAVLRMLNNPAVRLRALPSRAA